MYLYIYKNPDIILHNTKKAFKANGSNLQCASQ